MSFDVGNISLTATGIEETIARLDGIARQIAINVSEVLDWFGRTVTEEMQADHTFQNITGRLERSIGYTVESWSAGTVQANVFAMAPYAQAVEEGTPTSRPYPFFWPVIYKYLPELQERLQKAVTAAFVTFGENRVVVA
jgi:hypothetical protein